MIDLGVMIMFTSEARNQRQPIAEMHFTESAIMMILRGQMLPRIRDVCAHFSLFTVVLLIHFHLQQQPAAEHNADLTQIMTNQITEKIP